MKLRVLGGDFLNLRERYFPENSREMLTAAQYMLSEGNVMYYIDDYTETHKPQKMGI